MATIGSVTKRPDGRYEGELRTLSIRAEIVILPVGDKASPNQPDFRVLSQGIEIGAANTRNAMYEYTPNQGRVMAEANSAAAILSRTSRMKGTAAKLIAP